MSTYTGSELATKYAAYLIYKGTATPTQINQITSPKIGYVYDVTESGTLNNGNITVVNGDAVVFLARGWTHMNNAGADEQIAEIAEEVAAIQEQIEGYDFSTFALKSELPEIPTNVSEFNNDAGYLTQHQSLAAYQTKTASDAAYVGKLSNLNTIADDGTIVQYTGETTSAYREGFFYIYHTGEGWENLRVSEGNENGIKHTATLGTGTEGEIVFYTGTTTADYVTNNFYKYTSGEWEWVDVPGVAFSYNTQDKTIVLSYGKTTKEINLNTAIKDNTDDELDGESENPIQNKVVKEALDGVKTVTDKLQADISGLKMQFDANNLQLILMDSEDNVIGTANLSTLAKDAMLEDVEIFTEAESGVSVSTPYLKFSFNTDAGTQPIRVPLADFVINVTTDAILSPISTNPVQNKVIFEAITQLQDAINDLTSTPDSQLSPTSIRPVQNRVITSELNDLDDRISALEEEGTGNYHYLKKVKNLSTYTGDEGEVVIYDGDDTNDFKNGNLYKRGAAIPAGVLYANMTEDALLTDGGGVTLRVPAGKLITETVNQQQQITIIWYGATWYPTVGQEELMVNFFCFYGEMKEGGIICYKGISKKITSYEELIGGVRIHTSDGYFLAYVDHSVNCYYAEEIKTGCILYITKSGFDNTAYLSSENSGDTWLVQITTSEQRLTTEREIQWSPKNYGTSKATFTDESGTYDNLPAATDNLQSGSTLGAFFSRIKKWFASLKKVCFTGSYNDLTDKLQNATTSAAGLMSAGDKTLLGNYNIIYSYQTAGLSPGLTDTFLQKFIAYIKQNYAGNVVMGVLQPSFIGCVYGYSYNDANYSEFQLIHWGGIIVFGENNGTFYKKTVTTS